MRQFSAALLAGAARPNHPNGNEKKRIIGKHEDGRKVILTELKDKKGYNFIGVLDVLKNMVVI